MSNISASENTLTALPERRARPRQTLRTLAYLDLDANNGGIVLNLGTGGLAFRTVAPLDLRGEVHLKVQLPYSSDQIEAAAQIVWLSETKQLGGLRFTQISEAANCAIEQWVLSQTSWTSSRDKLSTPPKAVELRPVRPRAAEIPWETFGPEPKLNSGPSDTARAEKIHREESLPKQEESGEPIFSNQWGRDPSAQTVFGISDASDASQEGSLNSDLGTMPTGQGAISIEGPVSNEQEIAPDNAITVPLRNRAAISLSHVVARIKRIQAPSRETAAWAAALLVATALLTVLFVAVRIWAGSSETVSETSHHPTVVASRVTNLATNPGHPKDNSKGALHNTNRRANNKPSRHLPATYEALADRPPVEVVSNAATFSASKSLQNPDMAKVGTPPPASTNTSASRSSPADSPAVADSLRIVDGRALKPSDRFNPCHLTYRVEPDYPDEAKQQHIEGVVKLHQSIGSDGSVLSVRVISGPPLLVQPAADAAQYWRYFPALLNGQPVETGKDIEIEFHLSN